MAKKKTAPTLFQNKKLKEPPLKIADMMNLGPAVEKDFKSMGITKPSQIKKMGAKKAFIKMLEGRLKINRSAKCCNALYLYAIYGAIHEITWTQIPESIKNEFKRFTDKLRKTGRFS